MPSTNTTTRNELTSLLNRRGILNGKGVARAGRQIYPNSSKLDSCPACGTHWIKHAGCIPTCAKLQAALKALREIADRPDHLGKRRLARNALASIKAICMSNPARTPERMDNTTNILPPDAPPGCAPCSGSDVRPCVSCGAPAVLKTYYGEYCKDCMQIHLVEKMFVNLTALQGKRP